LIAGNFTTQLNNPKQKSKLPYRNSSIYAKTIQQPDLNITNYDKTINPLTEKSTWIIRTSLGCITGHSRYI
jgi:hypothetical protein